MRRALFTLCVLVSIGCCIYTAAWFLSGRMQASKDRELAGQFHRAVHRLAEPEAALDSEGDINPLEELREHNPDIIGWITVEGTGIDYPIVQGRDNEYYLTRNFYREDNQRGSIFMDFRCVEESVNKIFYGHHMKDGSMFSDLEKYRDPDFRESHPEIHLFDLHGTLTAYQVAEVWYWDAANADELPFFERVDTFADYYPNASLLSLVTCDFTSEDARLVVVATRQPD